MSALQAVAAAKALGISIALDGLNIVLRADGPIPDALIEDLRRHKAEIRALFAAEGQPQGKACEPAAERFSGLYATEADYARRLVHYARQDGLGLTVKDGRLVIGIGGKSDADLLGELRAHEKTVLEVLREGSETSPIPGNPVRPAEGVCPKIVREPPFGCDHVPDCYREAWQAFSSQCPPSTKPFLWQPD